MVCENRSGYCQNNRGAKPNADNNYTVHENAVITFSKECWSKIVGLINSALGKNLNNLRLSITEGQIWPSVMC